MTSTLSFNGNGMRVVTGNSIAREVSSSNVAPTYSHPNDASETNACEATGTNGPAADELGSHSMPVTTPADSEETLTTLDVTTTATLAKPTSLTYTCAAPSPTPLTTGRAGTDVSTASTEELVV